MGRKNVGQDFSSLFLGNEAALAMLCLWGGKALEVRKYMDVLNFF